MQGEASFFDGETAGRHAVRVALSQDRMALLITGDSLPMGLRWPLEDLRALRDQAQPGTLVLTRLAETDDESPRDPARLVLSDPFLVGWLRKTRPGLFRADLRRGTGRRILRNVVLATGALVLMLFVILPAMADTMARLIPMQTEVRFGRSVVAQMERFLGAGELGGLHCDGAEGREALDAMVARLTDGAELEYELNVTVFDHPMLNAFAGPGGQVVLLRGLLEQADGPDAVAGVLAHEIGHVVHRDPTRNALRAAGSAGLLSMVLGDVAGGTVLVIVADQMMNASYSREAERRADAFALDMLDGAAVSAAGFAGFFEQLVEMEGGMTIPAYLATHPDSGDRAALARAHARDQQGTTPVLEDAEWEALRGICGGSPAEAS